MEREDDKELWELLGKKRSAEMSPFFARNVLRQVREEAQENSSLNFLSSWLRPRVFVPVSALAAALVVAGLTFEFRPLGDGGAGDDPPDLIASIDPQDFDVVADLDDLLAGEDDSLWSDSSSL